MEFLKNKSTSFYVTLFLTGLVPLFTKQMIKSQEFRFGINNILVSVGSAYAFSLPEVEDNNNSELDNNVVMPLNDVETSLPSSRKGGPVISSQEQAARLLGLDLSDFDNVVVNLP